ncbi:hypothetical protein ACU4GD_35490 [Cupriavidus basilensis]
MPRRARPADGFPGGAAVQLTRCPAARGGGDRQGYGRTHPMHPATPASTSAAARPLSRRWRPAGHRRRLPGCADGAHWRNPGRAALPQAFRVARSRLA